MNIYIYIFMVYVLSCTTTVSEENFHPPSRPKEVNDSFRFNGCHWFLEVSEKRASPKSSILVGFPFINMYKPSISSILVGFSPFMESLLAQDELIQINFDILMYDLPFAWPHLRQLARLVVILLI